jgi:phospholipase/carboxylesterase
VHIEKSAWGRLNSYLVHDLPAGRPPKLGIVLSHGYGAPGTDLVGLAQPLISLAPGIAEQAVLIFPAARLDLSSTGLPVGRAWWPVDLDRLINHPTPDVLASFRRDCPPGLRESRDMLMQLLEEAGQHFGLAADRFVLGGFSQGAMLAMDVALRLPKPPAGVIILSGALINEAEWRKLAPHRGPLTVLQSHGRQDSILPFPMAAALRDLLLESGADVDFVVFNGDHEIPPLVLERAAKFVAALIGKV